MICRHCLGNDSQAFVDLGFSPPSNAYLDKAQLSEPEVHYPLRVFVCRHCRLVQTEDFAAHDTLFNADYAYFSSYSDSWLDHARSYVERMVDRFGLSSTSHVVEVAANDGYLLQFVHGAGIPCLGVEPTHGTAEAARAKGLPIIEEFFGISLAERMVGAGQAADLTAANNVLAHVPDINDFVGGFARLLKPTGVATFEFPHFAELLSHGQFDTIYHEHFSYLSLLAAERIFRANGLALFDVEQLQTHGGSLRVYAQRSDSGLYPEAPALRAIRTAEAEMGLHEDKAYQAFQTRVQLVKDGLLRFLIESKADGARVAAYGAAAKGNTLLNFAGVRSDLVQFVVDRNPVKAGRFTPASHIPIVGEDWLLREQPDYILILPWNLREEIEVQLSYVRDWGAKLVTAVPQLTIF